MGLNDFFNALISPFKLLFGDPDKARILREGRSATAKILSIGEAGPGYVTVNDQPYVKFDLEIYEDDKEPYVTSLKSIVSRLAVAQFQPGAMMAVKIDPNDPLKVVFDTTGTAVEKPKVGNTDQAPIENGKPGMAEVLGIRKTDKEKNNNPVYLVNLEVTPTGGEKYTFEKEIPLPDFALPHFTVGRKYECVIDQLDNTKIMLDVKFG